MDMSNGNVELPSQNRTVTSRSVVMSTDVINVIPIQFRVGMLFAFVKTLAALRNHVGHILRVRSEPKMGWVHARRVIAPVQDAQSFRQRPDIQNVRGDVSLYSMARTPTVDSSITMVLPSGSPHPARTQFRAMFRNGTTFVDLLPKPLREVIRKSLCGQILSGNLNHRQFRSVRLTGPCGAFSFSTFLR